MLKIQHSAAAAAQAAHRLSLTLWFPAIQKPSQTVNLMFVLKPNHMADSLPNEANITEKQVVSYINFLCFFVNIWCKTPDADCMKTAYPLEIIHFNHKPLSKQNVFARKSTDFII